MTNTPHLNFDPALARALLFNEEDLVANQKGYLSPLQVTTLKRRLRFYIVIFIAFNMFMVLLWICVGTSKGIDSNKAFSIGLIFPLLVIAPVSWLLGGQLYRTRKDLKDQLVKSYRGQISKVIDSKSNNLIIIEDSPLNLSLQAYNAFQDHRKYAVYYVPNLKMIVSAEPLEPE